jgi:hypothetical protein
MCVGLGYDGYIKNANTEDCEMSINIVETQEVLCVTPIDDLGDLIRKVWRGDGVGFEFGHLIDGEYHFSGVATAKFIKTKDYSFGDFVPSSGGWENSYEISINNFNVVELAIGGKVVDIVEHSDLCDLIWYEVHKRVALDELGQEGFEWAFGDDCEFH